LRTVVDVQKAVTIEEVDEETRRERQHRIRLGRPDRATHRQNVSFRKRCRIAVATQVFAQRQLVIAGLQQRACFFVEAQDVVDHPQERRADDVGALREQRIQRRAVVFEAAALALQAEAHVGGLPGHAQLLQHGNEIRVGPVVEHDEAGVDGVVLALPVDIDGVGVAAGIVARFEHGHVVLAAQAPGCI
jgi:hypothetical protein